MSVHALVTGHSLILLHVVRPSTSTTCLNKPDCIGCRYRHWLPARCSRCVVRANRGEKEWMPPLTKHRACIAVGVGGVDRMGGRSCFNTEMRWHLPYRSCCLHRNVMSSLRMISSSVPPPVTEKTSNRNPVETHTNADPPLLTSERSSSPMAPSLSPVADTASGSLARQPTPYACTLRLR